MRLEVEEDLELDIQAAFHMISQNTNFCAEDWLFPMVYMNESDSGYYACY